MPTRHERPVPPVAGGEGFEPPTLGRRFGALLIDWALSIIIAGFFGDPVRDGWPPVVVLVAMYGILVGLFTQTPGMWVSRLRCVSYPDGRRIGVLRALVRGVLLCLVVPPLVMDGLRRGWHDRVAGSIVVGGRPAGGSTR